MAVKEQIENLVKLQEIDMKILGLRNLREQKPAQFQELMAEFEEKKKGSAKVEEAIKKLQVEQKEKELELKTKEETIKKLQVQLYQVKTNKEYQSIQKEIEGIKADSSVLEEEILHLLYEVDRQKEKIKEGKDQLTREESELQEKKKILDAECAQIDKELETLEGERQKILPGVEKGLLAKYERILKNKGGLAIVPVKGDACGGCYLNLPPQVINEIKMEKGIVVCESCARILYIEGE